MYFSKVCYPNSTYLADRTESVAIFAPLLQVCSSAMLFLLTTATFKAAAMSINIHIHNQITCKSVYLYDN